MYCNPLEVVLYWISLNSALSHGRLKVKEVAEFYENDGMLVMAESATIRPEPRSAMACTGGI